MKNPSSLPHSHDQMAPRRSHRYRSAMTARPDALGSCSGSPGRTNRLDRRLAGRCTSPLGPLRTQQPHHTAARPQVRRVMRHHCSLPPMAGGPDDSNRSNVSPRRAVCPGQLQFARVVPRGSGLVRVRESTSARSRERPAGSCERVLRREAGAESSARPVWTSPCRFCRR